jgi:hypothetical protein
MNERLQAPAGFHDATPDQQRQLILSLVLRGKVPLSEFLDTVTELATDRRPPATDRSPPERHQPHRQPPVQLLRRGSGRAQASDRRPEQLHLQRVRRVLPRALHRG